MIEIFPLQPGVELRCCRDGRFKHGCISVQLITPMTRETASMNALIPSVLLRGTREHPDLRSITMVLDDLYGAAVSPIVRRVGDYQTTGLYCSFMDDRFALPGDKVLEPMAAFLWELLTRSITQDGGFLPEFVESEKRNQISALESAMNDKGAYSVKRMLETMCREDSYSIPRTGDIPGTRCITPQALYGQYRKLLRESHIRIFYAGSADSGMVAQLIGKLFVFPDRAPAALPVQTDFRDCPGGDTRESMDVAQGKLCMGFTTGVTGRSEGFPAMMLLNLVFGGGMTSKLFLNVREKQSLCYSIGSTYYGAKGLIVVSAGIDFSQEQAAKEEILRQLEACRRGDITQEELTAAREAVLSSIRSAWESLGALESYYAVSDLGTGRRTLEAYAEAIEQVTLPQLVEAARAVTLHTTYFLKGECHD